jgi:hypothetical protein
MVWRFLVQGVTQKAPQGQRIGSTPSDGPFRVQALEISDQRCSKVNARGNTRPAIRTRLVELPAECLDPPIEVMLIQNLVQSVVEAIAGRFNYSTAGNPKVLLPLSLLTGSHRHVC